MEGDAAGEIFRRLHTGTSVRNALGIPLQDRLRDVWNRRDVLRILVERALRQKYANSVLGYAWSLIQPAMFIATYFLLIKILNRTTPMYPLFIAATILPWQWFQSTVNSTTTTLRQNRRLITSIALPREIYPLADVGAKFVDFVLSLPIVVIVAWIYGVKPSPYLAAFPLAVVLELMICTGFALLVSALNTVLRDVQRAIGIILRILFYLVPVLYSLKTLSPASQRIESYNPLVGILEINRAVWLPAYWTNWRPVYFSVIGAVIILVMGFLVFVRIERTVLKEL